MLDYAVTGYLSHQEIKELDDLADAMKLSRSALVREAILKLISTRNKEEFTPPSPYTNRRRKGREEHSR